MDFSLKKSFKSHGSYNKHTRKISASGSGGGDSSHEEQPILHGEDHHDQDHNGEVIVKIDGENSSKEAGKMWRESSYDFWEEEDGNNAIDRGELMEDPPSKLIGQFLNKQKSKGGEVSLDMDLEMDELQPRNNNRDLLPPLAESPMMKEVKVSFQPHSSSKTLEIEEESTRKKPHESAVDDKEEESKHFRSVNFNETTNGGGGDGNGLRASEVLRCTSNSTFQRRTSLLRAKTRSRLIDPTPEELEMERKSGRVGKSGPMKSGPLKSGLLAKVMDDEEDDPLLEEDLPEDFKSAKLNALTLLQWLILILIIASLISTLSIPFLRRQRLYNLKLWRWEMLVLVLICGRLVSGWGIRLIVFFIERNFVLRKKVLYFVYGVRKAVQNCLWLGLVLLAWHFLFDEKVERETKSPTLKYVTKILVCFLVATLLWLVKTLIIKVLASSFHVSTYFDRIQESLFNQYVFETLSGPPMIEIQHAEEEGERLEKEVRKLQNAGVTVPPDLRASAFAPTKSGRLRGNGGLQKNGQGKSARFSSVFSKKEEGISIDHLHKLSPKNISAWNMKRLMKIVRHGVLSTLDEQILGSAYEDESTTQIRSEVEAKIAARKIFQNVAKHGSKYIYLEDLMRFMRDDEALKTMSLFDGSTESRRISKSSLKNWVVNAFRERRALALTLNDTKTAVNKLHKVVNIIVSIIILVISLLVLGIATREFLVLLSSQLVVAAFIFGNTCKTIFEAIIFLFVIHPFDVGDRCEVDTVQMVVEEMNILTTVFLRFDNQKLIFPNSVLSTKPIGNFYRSPDMGDAIDFSIHIATPAEKIAIIKQRITSFIESKKEHWYPAPTVIVKDFDELNKVKMAVWSQQRMNFQNMGERWTRRAILVEEMIKILNELDIQYRLLPLDINIHAMPPINFTRLPPSWTTNSS